MLSILLGAIGNRLWGWGGGSHIAGCLVMAAWAADENKSALLAFAIAFVGIFFWRVWPTSSWLDLTKSAGTWELAIMRGFAVAPYALAMFIFDGSSNHLIFGLLAIFAVPLCYWLSGKQKKIEPVALAEVAAGVFIGLVGV